MGKEVFQLEQKTMDAAVFVDRAREMAAALEDREAFEAKSRPAARRRVARLAGIPASLLHSLRYRRPKTIAADVFDKLCAAVERQALKQIRTARHEISTARARRLGANDRALCEIEVALCRARELLKKEG